MQIKQIATTYCSSDWRWDLKDRQGISDLYYLWIVVAGRGELLEGGRLHDVGPGDCLLIPAWEAKRGRHDPGNPLIVSWAELGISGEEWPITADHLHVKLDRLGFLNELFSRSIDACRRSGMDGPVGRKWMACLVEELFELSRKPMPRSTSQHADAIDELCDAIRLDPAAYGSVSEIAGRLHLSVDHFIRLFKQARGVTPGEFVVNARIEAAASLLMFTRRNVSEIADQLGYCDAFHFSRQFKHRMGVSPLVYRRDGQGKTSLKSKA